MENPIKSEKVVLLPHLAMRSFQLTSLHSNGDCSLLFVDADWTTLIKKCWEFAKERRDRVKGKLLFSTKLSCSKFEFILTCREVRLSS